MGHLYKELAVLSSQINKAAGSAALMRLAD